MPDLQNKGEFISILGPSGCGKSTVLRLIAALRPHYPATEGTVLVSGRPVSEPGADRSMVFQDYTSFDNRTVEDNVAFGLECRGVGALTPGRIDRRPVVDPFFLDRTVLNREDKQSLIAQFGCECLLPLRSDHVVHTVSLPRAITLRQFKVGPVPTAGAHRHACSVDRILDRL